MEKRFNKSLPEGVPVVSDTALLVKPSTNLLARHGGTNISNAIDAYMAVFVGKDKTRGPYLDWWRGEIGHLTLDDVEEDHIFFVLEKLSKRSPRQYAGKDADGDPIFKAKAKPYAPATINRYAAAIGALFTWCIKKRFSPKGWIHPCRGIERLSENNEIVRFLSDSERTALLSACKASKWNKLYLITLMAMTTGARRAELENLRWSDINWERCEASIAYTKNGDKKILPLLPNVMSELERFKSGGNALIFSSGRCPNQPFNFVPRWEQAIKLSKVKKFRFHDLRHTCASYLAQHGASLLQIGDVLGQRQPSVTKRYSHLTTKHKTALVNEVLGSYS